MNLFGKRLEDLLSSKSMKQVDLANELNLSRATISAWVKGRAYPDFQTLVRLVEYFKVSADFLMDTSYAERPLFPVEESEEPELSGLYSDVESMRREIELLKQVVSSQSTVIRFFSGDQKVPKKVSEKLLKDLFLRLQFIENQFI